MAKNKPLTSTKRASRNLKRSEANKVKHEKAKARNKKKWTEKDIENYFKYSKIKDDFSCPNYGIIETIYPKAKKTSKKKKQKKRKKECLKQ